MWRVEVHKVAAVWAAERCGAHGFILEEGERRMEVVTLQYGRVGVGSCSAAPCADLKRVVRPWVIEVVHHRACASRTRALSRLRCTHTCTIAPALHAHVHYRTTHAHMEAPDGAYGWEGRDESRSALRIC